MAQPSQQLNFNATSAVGDRVFYKSAGWFFATREGLDMGPFPSRRSAESEIGCYLRSMRKITPERKDLYHFPREL
jgi:hypothetical protein